MKIDDLKAVKNRRPFEPFEIHLADGRGIPIGHPDALAWQGPESRQCCTSSMRMADRRWSTSRRSPRYRRHRRPDPRRKATARDPRRRGMTMSTIVRRRRRCRSQSRPHSRRAGASHHRGRVRTDHQGGGTEDPDARSS